MLGSPNYYIATLILTVNSIVTSTTNTTICSNQLPYNWNGKTYTAAGIYSDTLTSASGCDSVNILVLTVSPILTSTTNTTICSNQLPYNWNGKTYNIAGTYNDTLSSSTGCDSIATLVLTVNPIITSTANVAICSNQLPFTWNGKTYSIAGTYNDTLINVAGCDSIATLVLTVDSIVTSITNTTICSNQLPYSWNGKVYAESGSYKDTLISVSGCDSIATLVLTVSPIIISTTTITICPNQLPYIWNGYSYNIGGIYIDTLRSATGCDSIPTLILKVSPVLTSLSNITICFNQLPYNWNGKTYNIAGTYTDTLSSAAGCDSIATIILTVSPILTSTANITICSNQLPYSWNSKSYISAGTYNDTLISAAGCDSIATLVLTVSSTLTSTSNTTICFNQLPYRWNGNAYTSAGTYVDSLTSAAGCDSIAT